MSRAKPNNPIARHLHQCAENLDHAIRGLNEMGINVLAFIGGETRLPVVKVQFSRACLRLAPDWIKETIHTEAGRRMQTMEVSYRGCKVIWHKELHSPWSTDTTVATLQANRQRQAQRQR